MLLDKALEKIDTYELLESLGIKQEDIGLIPLSQDQVAIVDQNDYGNLIKYKWHVVKIKGKYFYAVRHERIGECQISSLRKNVFMHRQVMNISGDILIDHKNGYGLDNRRENLRLATRQQNMFNSNPIGGSSRHKGVSWHKRKKKWIVHIGYNAKLIHLGYFDSEEEAALAYNEAAVKYHGEFARLNDVIR